MHIIAIWKEYKSACHLSLNESTSFVPGKDIFLVSQKWHPVCSSKRASHLSLKRWQPICPSKGQSNCPSKSMAKRHLSWFHSEPSWCHNRQWDISAEIYSSSPASQYSVPQSMFVSSLKNKITLYVYFITLPIILTKNTTSKQSPPSHYLLWR